MALNIKQLVDGLYDITTIRHLVLTSNCLHGNTQEPSHIPLLAYYRHPMDQGDGEKQVTEIDKCSARETTRGVILYNGTKVTAHSPATSLYPDLRT